MRSSADHRLLEKIEAGALHRAHIGERLFGAVALIGVGGNQHAATENLANLACARGIVFRRVHADLDLVGGEPGRFLLFGVAQIPVEIAAADHGQQRHAAASLLAEQGVYRFLGGAAGEIVQRDFNRSLGTVIAVHAAIHGCQCAGDVGGVAPVQGRGEIMDRRDNALERLAGHHRRGRGFPPSHHAGVGFDAHQHVVGAPDFLARHDDRLEHRQADRNRLDGFDQHITLR